mmetsp:Transcript_11936/g.24230  ORF Transcript_11936/g.24230 Transcript_11936/m.24230 type:complete len:330 (-) Transcript_11936:2835-3824(-)
MGQVRGLDLLPDHLVPVQAREEPVDLKLLRPEGGAAVPFRAVLGEQPQEEAPRSVAQPLVESRLPRDHVPEGVVVRAPVEGVAAGHHLVHEQAEAPPVDALCVPALEQHLGRHVLLRPAERPRREAHGPPPLLPVLRKRVSDLKAPAQPEVRQLDVPVSLQEHVLRLQVPVNDVDVVQGLEGERDLANVELSPALLHPAHLAEEGEEVAPLDEVHDHVQLRVGLEGVRKRHHEGVTRRLLKYVPLRLRPLHLPPPHQLRLLQNLHRVNVAILLVPDLHHLAKPPPAQDREELEVVEARVPLLRGPVGALLLVEVDELGVLLLGLLELLC